MKKTKIEIGRLGERMAEDYLISKGYEFIAKNERTEYGEIDLLFYDPSNDHSNKKCLVFVEVKTRTNRSFGNPEEAITRKKEEHLLHSALDYLQNHVVSTRDWRIDVISILLRSDFSLKELSHFENAVNGD